MPVSKATAREVIRLLNAPAQAFERAKQHGHVVLDGEQMLALEAMCPALPDNPDQMPLWH